MGLPVVAVCEFEMLWDGVVCGVHEWVFPGFLYCQYTVGCDPPVPEEAGRHLVMGLHCAVL